jgi:PIN domain nuclease of toxin-antitoxin system
VKSILRDTHTWVWSFGADDLLSDRARAAVGTADVVYLSPISFFEIGQKVRNGRWPEMDAHVERLPDILRTQGGVLAPFSPEICLKASLMDWQHRDPFDRLILATAEIMQVPLVSKDRVLHERHSAHVIW